MAENSPKRKKYKPTYLAAIEGRELYNHMRNRVVEYRTSNGKLVAVKNKPEAEMMHFASHQGILAPRMLGCYDVEPEVIATVTDVVPGESLDKAWHSLTKEQRNTIKDQLKEQLLLFRTITRPYIGRINYQETFNFFDRLHFHFMGPFESEEEFDEFCLARVKSPIVRSLWKRLLPKMRAKGSFKFVLTHGDLAARNIMVHNGQLSGIMDWEYSGFIRSTWMLKEVLEPCGFKRARFVTAVKDRGW
ncbi:kinase-like domain-containing protein [Aspergillus aurantiobrunneus]